MNKEFNVENLGQIYDELAAQYMLLYVQTSSLLDEYFKDRNIDPSFPINYFDLAKWLKIEVTYEDLNYFRSRLQTQWFGKIEKNEKGQWCMAVERTAARLDQRYAICYGIASYICNFQKNTHIYNQTKIPNTKESILINIVTAYLAFPPNLIFKEVDNYIKSRAAYVDMNEMFCFVSALIQMPHIKVAENFEYIKILGCYLVCEQEKIKEILQKSIKSDEVLSKKIDDILNQECIVPASFYT